MKTILLSLLFVNILFADYSIYYNNLKLGSIQNFESLKNNYFLINVTNPIARFMLGSKQLVFNAHEAHIPKNIQHIKKKKDKHDIIQIIKRSINNELTPERIYFKAHKYLDIKKEENYTFEYVSKGHIRTKGVIAVENNQLVSIIDTKNNIKIINNDFL